MSAQNSELNLNKYKYWAFEGKISSKDANISLLEVDPDQVVDLSEIAKAQKITADVPDQWCAWTYYLVDKVAQNQNDSQAAEALSNVAKHLYAEPVTPARVKAHACIKNYMSGLELLDQTDSLNALEKAGIPLPSPDNSKSKKLKTIEEMSQEFKPSGKASGDKNNDKKDSSQEYKS